MPERASDLHFGPRDVAFGRLLAEVPGHYRVSLELYVSGKQPAALIHASHPLMEVLPAVYEDLLQYGSAEEIARAMGAAATAVREHKTAQDVNAVFERVTKLSSDSIVHVVGQAATTPAYTGSVIAALLRAAARKYERALGEGRIALLPEYEDAYGFVRQAARMLAELAPRLESDQAARIEEAVREIESSLAELDPPAEPPPAEALQAQVASAGASLRDVVGALLHEQPTVEEAIDRLEYRFALLGDVLQHGEKGRAEKLVARMHAEDLQDLGRTWSESQAESYEQLRGVLERLRLQINKKADREEIAASVRKALEIIGRPIG